MQMISQMQIVKPGAQLWGQMIFRDVTKLELDALQSGLSYACEGKGPNGGLVMPIAAKRNAGYGKLEVFFEGEMIRVISPEGSVCDAFLPVPRDETHDAISDYAEHLRKHAEVILTLLDEIAS